jgi:hypothetical protein
VKFDGELYAVLADSTGSAASTAAPWWLSLFTGIAGLLGTVVGGGITYATTRSANKREEKAERERRRIGEIREISIRFIRLVSRPEMQQTKIEELAGKFQATLEGFAEGKDPKQILTELGELNPLMANFGPLGGMAKGLGAVFKEMERMAPHVSESTSLIAEMRLIVPNRIVQIAEIASNLAIMEQLKDQINRLLPKDSQVPGLALIDVLAVFTNEIRREMGVDPYVSINTSNPLEVAQFIEDLAVEHSQSYAPLGISSQCCC